MKKIYSFIAFLIVFSFAFQGNLNAQCTPDSTFNIVGFTPNPIPEGCVGVPYSEVISFVFPNDTTIMVGPLEYTIPFDSFLLDTIMNIPDGLTFECNVSSCTYVTNAPDITRGCVTVAGTPTAVYDSATDSITVVGKAFLVILGQETTYDIPLPIYVTVQEDPNCFVGISPALDGSTVKVYPNPVNETSKLALDLNSSYDVDAAIYDLFGRKVMNIHSGQVSTGISSFEFNASSLSPAIYAVRVNLNNGESILTTKIVVGN